MVYHHEGLSRKRNLVALVQVCLLVLGARCCTPGPGTVYYRNPAYSAPGQCPGPGYYTASTVPNRASPSDITTVCNSVCKNSAGGSPASCKAYVATQTVNAQSGYDVACFLYSTQAPAPVPSCGGNALGRAAGVYAASKDDSGSCFAASQTAASRYCSFYYKQLNRGGGMKFAVETTAPPSAATTVTKYHTKSVCNPAGGRRRLVLDSNDEFPEQAAVPLALTSAAQDPAITSPPVLHPRAKQVRPPPAPPACLDTKNLPQSVIASACSCLLGKSQKLAAIADIFTADSTTNTTPTPVLTQTVKVTVTMTMRVSKSAVPTFSGMLCTGSGGTEASWKDKRQSDGDQQSPPVKHYFGLLSRSVRDATGASKRVLLYDVNRDGITSGTGSAGVVVMNVGGGIVNSGHGGGGDDDNDDGDNGRSAAANPGDGRLYVVSPSQHKLRLYGQLAFVTGGAATTTKDIGTQIGNTSSNNTITTPPVTSSTTINVLGEAPAGTSISSSTSTPGFGQFYNCTIGSAVQRFAISCNLDAAGSTPAVFYVFPVPGQTGRYMIAVGSTEAAQGSKVVSLYGSKFGSMTLGCGGTGKRDDEDDDDDDDDES